MLFVLAPEVTYAQDTVQLEARVLRMQVVMKLLSSKVQCVFIANKFRSKAVHHVSSCRGKHVLTHG